jgi:hypothetical protein
MKQSRGEEGICLGKERIIVICLTFLLSLIIIRCLGEPKSKLMMMMMITGETDL